MSCLRSVEKGIGEEEICFKNAKKNVLLKAKNYLTNGK